MEDVEIKAKASSELNKAPTAPCVPCCSRVGNGHVQVISNSRRSVNGGAFAEVNRIILPDNSSSSPEIIMHEWAHIYTNFQNDRIPGFSDGFADAFREGMADTIQGLYGPVSSKASEFGEPFVMGDGQGIREGQSPEGTRRDGRVPRTWNDLAVLPNSHARGQVFYNFFFRLANSSAQPSFQRLLGLALGAVSNIRNTPGKTLDVQDFVRAVLAAVRDDEVALRKAVNDVSEAMYNRVGTGPLPAPRPPGEPGPSGAPLAPAFVVASFGFCGTVNGGPVSVYNVSWGSSFDASQYGGYSKTSAEFAYSLTEVYPAPQTTGTFVTNTNAEGRIAACNSFGCSGLSESVVDFIQQPQCASF
jgi:hypothetical protein